MDVTTARAILGVTTDATLAEITAARDRQLQDGINDWQQELDKRSKVFLRLNIHSVTSSRNDCRLAFEIDEKVEAKRQSALLVAAAFRTLEAELVHA